MKSMETKAEKFKLLFFRKNALHSRFVRCILVANQGRFSLLWDQFSGRLVNGMERKCPCCGSSIAYNATYCPYCDRLIDAEKGIPAFVRDVQADPLGRAASLVKTAEESAAVPKPTIARGMNAVLAARKTRREQKDAQTESDFLFADAASSDGLMVCGYIGAYPAELVIPSQHNGRPVVEIGREAFKEKPVSRVVIPPSVQSIGEGAFQDCVSLYEVGDGSGIRTIGKDAFKGCCALNRFPVLLSGGIQASYSSFAGCYHLGLGAESACSFI